MPGQKEEERGEGPVFEDLILSSRLVGGACCFAKKAHEGVNRKSGGPFFLHPVEVARILFEDWGVTNKNVLAAALLHDVVEDGNGNRREALSLIEDRFGERVAFYVEMLTKPEGLSGNEADLAMDRRMTDCLLSYPEVVIIKMADRLHNLRTIGVMPREVQIKKALETKCFYVFWARFLGMEKLAKQFEDLCGEIFLSRRGNRTVL